ncbi:MAG: glycosyltransferase, partial [Tetragenococcus koreensis]|nr:glycosyltransferase [Tetragenococcus koreensis]MDN6572212.1 glycosyltransferase [Staphylococcus equorum]MDN6733811.1 glycosyltransferase [Tetragenococcus koreensis]
MLSIVVPCFNEQESLPYFVKEVEKVASIITHSVEYVFVNDGSQDDTLQSLRQLYKNMPDRVRYVSFSKNFGKESALYAGLHASRGDLVTVMDADLQDPPDLLPQMI